MNPRPGHSNPFRKPKLAAALAVVGLAFVLTACSSKPETVDPANPDRTPFSVALDWYANPDHAGFLVARDRGFFDDAGLEVDLQEPTDPALPLKLVAAGEVDLAISYQPEVLLAREKGSDVVAVASIVGRPLTSMIWLPKSKIESVADLEGKTVSTAGIPYQKAYLETILTRAGVPPDSVRTVGVGQGLTPSIIGGRADATLGPFWNIEGVTLREEGRKPTVKPVDRLGVPSYDELVLVADRSSLAEDPTEVCLFISALARGTDLAVSRPGLATAAVLDANPALARDRAVTRAQVETTLPLLAGEGGSRPFGYMSSVEWQRFINWAFENEVLSEGQRAVEALNNDYLPGECVETGIG
ncbi:MAG: ABC transporter substrate-binding protein [Solirubrobacterales bacterium]